MKRWIALVLAALLAAWQLPSQAQARAFSQPELDALLAPVALYPDPVLSNILQAATYPDDLREAAAWSRENPQLAGEDALRAAEPISWHPSVKALLAFPDLLARMDESPQWTADLAAAFRDQEPYVMDTVQALRRRAQANGSLQSNDQYTVQQQDSSIAVYPAQPQVVYVPYYNPYVVYGPWWWPAYRPVFWRPWHARPTAFVSSPVFFVRSVDWHRRHVVRHVVHHHAHHAPAAKPIHPVPAHQANAGWHRPREHSRHHHQPQNARPHQPQNARPQQPQLQWHRHLPQQQWHQQQTQQQPRQPERHHSRQPQRRAETQAPRVHQPAAPVASAARPMVQSTPNVPRAAAIGRHFGQQDRRASPPAQQQQRRQVQAPQRRG